MVSGSQHFVLAAEEASTEQVQTLVTELNKLSGVKVTKVEYSIIHITLDKGNSDVPQVQVQPHSELHRLLNLHSAVMVCDTKYTPKLLEPIALPLNDPKVMLTRLKFS